MNATKKWAGAALVAGVAVAGLAVAPAVASAQDLPLNSVYADLDADGRADLVTVTQISPDQLRLDADLGVRTVSAVVGDSGTPVTAQRPRVLDLDADGRNELAIPEQVYANTSYYSVFTFVPGKDLVRTVTTGGDVLRLPEGGGNAGPVGYTCTGSEPGQRLLWTTTATPTSADATRYDAQRAAYTVRDGVATQVEDSAAVDAPRTWLDQQRNSAACGVLNAG